MNQPVMSASSSVLSVQVAGIALRSPLVLLSGCVGFGEELFDLCGTSAEARFDFHDVGAICLKGTTLEARKGNPPPRLAETPAGLLNAIGLQNPGARAVVDEILPRLVARLREREAPHPVPLALIANISGASVEEYGEVARIFDDSPVAAIEVNISCPNVKQGGAAFGGDPVVAAAVTAAVRRATRKPVIVKLSPNVTDIRAVARAVVAAGADALSVINTLMGMAIDADSRRPVLGNVQGGLSGPAIKPVALLKVWQVHQEVRQHNIPIIGQGGVVSATDVREFMIAGAAAVGLGTALFRNPMLPATINAELRQVMQREGLTSLASLTGSLVIA